MVAPDEAGDLSRSLVRVPGSGYDRSAAPSTCDLGRVSSLAATVPINPQLPGIITNLRTAPPTRLSESDAAVAKLGTQLDDMMRPSGPSGSPLVPQVLLRKRPLGQTQASATPVGTATTTPFPAMPSPPAAQTIDIPVGYLNNKRARITHLTPQQAVRYAPNILHVNTHAGPVLFMPVHPQSSSNSCRTRLVPSRRLLQQTRTTDQTAPVQEQTSATGQQANGTQTGQQGTKVSVITLEQLLRQQSSLRHENETLQQQISMFQQLFQDRRRLENVVRQLGIKIDTNNDRNPSSPSE